MKRSKGIYLALLAVLLSPIAANADIVYTSPDFGRDDPSSYWCSDCNAGGFITSDIFTMAADATITGADFAIAPWYGSDWNIEIGIWDAAFQNLLWSVTMAFGTYTLAPVNANVSMVSATFSGPDLLAGNYRMSFYDSVRMANPGFGGNSSTQQQKSSGGIAELETGQSFQVYGTTTVPEPGTLVLLGLGLVGMTARRRKQA